MIVTTKEPVRWTVPWLPEDRGRSYFFRGAASTMERGFHEAELTGDYRAGEVFDFQLSRAFESGVRKLLDGMSDVDRLVQLDQASRVGDELDEEEQAILDEAKSVIAAHWQPYRLLIGQASRRSQFLPLVTFRRFCTGWEGADLPEFARGVDGLVSDAIMLELPTMEWKAGGTFAYNLLYGASLEQGKIPTKNSSGPLSNADGGPRTSTSPRSKAGGRSRVKSGTKTPS